MKPLLKTASFLVALLVFAAPQIAGAELKVVATVGDLGAAVEKIGGDRVEVEVLASPQQDPHFVDAKPSFVRKVAEADLLVFNGMSLEIGWLPTLIENSRNAKIQKGGDGYFDASAHIQRKGVPTGEVSRSEGDVHPEGNPHYTIDPRQMARVAFALGKTLGELDPKHADDYRKRAKAFAKEALQTGKYWEKQFAKLPDTCHDVVVYHEAWAYLLDWLDLDAVIPVEPKPGVPPNPKHIAKVFQTMKSKKVPAIIQMEYYPDSNTKMLAERTGAYLLTVQGQTREGEEYFKRINKMAGELFSAVKARCDGSK